MKRGFTLIEMMIVISIIMVLATLTLNYFGSYRKSVVLSLAKDNLLGLIDESRTKVQQGHNNADGEPVCFGIYGKTGDEGVWKVQWPYDSRDYYDSDDQEYKVGRCDLNVSVTDEKVEKEFISFRDEVQIKGLFLAGESENEQDVLLLYRPPEAEFVNTFSKGALKKSYVKMLLSAENAVEDYELKINLLTGLVLDE